MKNLVTLTSILLITVFLGGCSDDNPNSAQVIVTLTDSPGDYDAVNVDVQGIEVHRQGGNQQSGWISLDNVNVGVYDLIQLTNGVEVVLINTEFPIGQISQMRLLLGDNNSLEIGDQTMSLKVPSGSQSGLKLQINESLLQGVTYTFKLDFDAARSVVRAGASGGFILKPVIRVITEAASGAISGEVAPASENVAIYAMQGMDTVGTSFAIEAISEFVIAGLAAGTYDVVFDPGELSTLQPSTIQGVVVIIGEVTAMDAVTLQ